MELTTSLVGFEFFAPPFLGRFRFEPSNQNGNFMMNSQYGLSEPCRTAINKLSNFGSALGTAIILPFFFVLSA
ncbi:hypothetical protein CDL15_Pgr018616 [Punica granatum]|uniref:Uncharacterized protein n=1 Tax=Punica granatum TaxID=22663 RepID=A0A218WZ44_PUNGR|nr:hypothetical protein CDL15_Pgr018616 [Punica granatum]